MGFGSGFRFQFRFALLFRFVGALAVLTTVVVPTFRSAVAQEARQGAKPVARPNFDGIWNSATTTPLERPAQLKDKAFFTPEEAAAWERQVTGRNQSTGTGIGTYNTVFREFGTRTVKTLRTSI